MTGQTLGRILLATGLLVAAAGAYLALGGRLPFGNLPGDITVSRGGVSVSLLLGTGILLSIVLTVILNIVVRR
ncbi:MAG: DUF2905 domain-containing protein [Candidatus Dormibacteria bacterium]|jgi:hypothetical protein